MNAAPAQKVLVERFVSWDRIAKRLDRYESIRRAFPRDLLERHRNTPPYHCHYMTWRLGTWFNESLFARLNELLARAEGLPGWNRERGLLENPDFAAFWALVWQLQVAEHLCSVGSDVHWGNPGPDLSVMVGGRRLFVECYVFRKSFGVNLFLEEVLGRVGPDIKLDHDYCLPFSLPSDAATEAFLDKALRPFLDEAALVRLRAKARKQHPVVVVRPASTLVINLMGDDMEKYDPRIVPSVTGDPDAHIAVILTEAIGQKAGANQLEVHRPNLVAVNYLLSTDAQLAFNLRGLRPVVVPESIDGFAVAPGVGIDGRLDRSQLVLVGSKTPRDPILEVVADPM